MAEFGKATPGQFCWADLAAADAAAAKQFYERLLGWKSCEQVANGGSFTRLRASDRDIGSIYQLQRANLDRGVPSHRTPYVQGTDVSDVARRAEDLGGAVIVRPFAVSGIARIALIVDAVGAQVGLWESTGREEARSA